MKGQKENPRGGNREAQIYTHRECSNFYSLQQVTNLQATMNASGLSTKDRLVADGRLRRFHIEGDRPGSKNGWYVLYGDSLPAGAFGCWKRQISETWCMKEKRTLSTAEREQFQQRMAEALKARKSEEQSQRTVAQAKARLIWHAAAAVSDNHPYLMKKSIRNYGLRLHKGALVIPLRDSAGALHSLQFIDCNGGKRFLYGGRIQGCHFLIGKPQESLCIAEGYATAASIYEATGLPVAVAFNCGNLLPVARSLRAKFPHIKIIICADNDKNTPGNPGLTKAQEAAAAIGGLVAIPPGAGDFNDLINIRVR